MGGRAGAAEARPLGEAEGAAPGIVTRASTSTVSSASASRGRTLREGTGDAVAMVVCNDTQAPEKGEARLPPYTPQKARNADANTTATTNMPTLQRKNQPKAALQQQRPSRSNAAAGMPGGTPGW